MAKTNSVLPLIILFIVVGVAAGVGYIVFSIVQDISNKTKEKMEKKNLTFTKDGLKVGIQEIKDEDYKAKSQSVLVNVWNHSSFPGYKSRLWNSNATPDFNPDKVEKRRPRATPEPASK